MHLVRRTHIDVSAETGNAASDADPPRLFELEEPFPVTNQSLTFHVTTQAPPLGSIAPTDSWLDVRFHARLAFTCAARPLPRPPG
jgi:hypothetical protein